MPNSLAARLRAATMLATGLAALTATSAQAQDAPAEADPAQIVPTGDTDAGANTATSYTPDQFVRFAPRNALDVLERIPGFTATGANDDQRGLGQATANVLVNGERLASKSDSVFDQLRRIPLSNIVRIDIVDGASLDVPGLSGQVANVITSQGGVSGQFTWRTGFRAHNTKAQLFGGEASLTGSAGALDYTVAISNANDRFGADGPVVVFDPLGNPIERQDTKFSGGFDNPKIATNLAYDFGGQVLAKLNLSYNEDVFYRDQPETALTAAGVGRVRDARTRENGPEYEIGGDVEFPLGPGKLKLIGLERYERDNYKSVVIDRFDDGSATQGFRFNQINATGERIGRFEYGWKLWNADWQLSGEAAFNRLDRASALFEMDGAENFVPVAFPSGTGGVTEDRYETILSFGKQLTPTLAFQATGGMEYSILEQTGTAANSRKFQRPKGSASLTWKPRADFDISAEVRRRVGQLSFGDFLASVSLNDDNQSGANNQLVPNQSWNVEVEANKRLGPWGSVKLELRQAWFEDFIAYVPLPDGGEARGNVGNAERTHLEGNATINLDPLGWRGARVEARGVKRWMSETDAFTGETRPFSYDLIDELQVQLRHDIPQSDWAYGGSLYTNQNAPYARRYEVGREGEGPSFVDLYVENKDVFGLTVNARVANILGARNKFQRTVFAGDRPDAPVLFSEVMDRRIGPIFRFSVSGDF